MTRADWSSSASSSIYQKHHFCGNNSLIKLLSGKCLRGMMELLVKYKIEKALNWDMGD